MKATSLKAIAIHLPQFHPIPENDAWWGKGFTEWTNVTKAKPLFRDHYQPHLPADLGFYDLRLEETRVAQAELAKQYGIYGFCYYHYWFNGKQLLEKPLQGILESNKPDFPFCVCWANENWTRRWDGNETEVLMKQNYSTADDEAHMVYLCTLFRDKRYIRVNDKPVFVVYRTNLLPDVKKTVNVWRAVARREGIGEIYLCRMESIGFKSDPAEMGFDAAIEFQPDFEYLPHRDWGTLLQRALFKLGLRRSVNHEHTIVHYDQLVEKMVGKPKPNYKIFPGITPGWDNSARRKKGALIIHGSRPELYKKWLRHIRQRFNPYSPEENFVFINAWNEWAEGNHLEPCQKWGKAYLEATKEILSQ